DYSRSGLGFVVNTTLSVNHQAVTIYTQQQIPKQNSLFKFKTLETHLRFKLCKTKSITNRLPIGTPIRATYEHIVRLSPNISPTPKPGVIGRDSDLVPTL